MSGEQDLAKLTIRPDGGQDILVLFNPNSYTITKSVTWNADQASGGKNHTQIELNAPPLKFGGHQLLQFAFCRLTLDCQFPLVVVLANAAHG